MKNMEALNKQFGKPGAIEFKAMKGNLTGLSISNRFAEADICLYGAHVTRFKPRNGADLLWMSPDSLFEVGKPIRGGIPVCFPWFGPHKTDPQKPMHGFARLMYWEVLSIEDNDAEETVVRLGLGSSDETKGYWPFDFRAVLTVVVGSELTVTLGVTNLSAESFRYTCALHTYYHISAIEKISITGLQGVTYFNQLTGEKGRQEEEILVIREAMTRHYLDTETPVVLEDSGFPRRIRAGKSGSRVTTVWNPGAEACATIGDLPNEGYKSFVCIESTNAYDFPVEVNPGESFVTTAQIGIAD
ncbi:MAG: D-hexose-6-phosphate mutarotase [Marinilabiliales bacterium]|nr:D-hexose-6-phosphate mutarotase [Marinilabiliales bacterium]